MKSPILGSSYVARSVNAADNRMVNLFPEIVPEGGKEPAFLQRAPGMSDTGYFASSVLDVKCLHTYVYGNTDYLVIARDEQISTSTNGAAPVYRGNIALGSGTKVTMAHNDTQVFIANRTSNTGWIMNMGSFAITQEAGSAFAPDFIGVGTVVYLDGYFVFNTPGTNRIYVSDLLDGTNINPLAFANADASPDLLQTIATINGELWVFGTNSIEVWSNVGTTPFPFAPIQGSFNETGCAAIDSVATLDNSLFWLGKDSRGQGVIYRSNGYRPERVSTHAIEWQIQRYSDISDAIAYTYQQDGHAFYVITFPTGNATWVYDVSTQAWHERASWDGSAFNRHIATCQAFYEGQTLVGCTDGTVNILSTDVYKDVETTSRWLRSWRALPTGQNNLKRTAQHSVQIDCNSYIDDDDSPDPPISLRWSDDGGHNWNDNAREAIMSTIINPSRRVIYRRLGMTTSLRDRVYEISGTAAVPVFIMGAELILSPTDA
jgi:hypothetical protein